MTEVKHEISKSGPDEPVAIDDWSYKIVIRYLNSITGLDYEYIYQPIPIQDAIFHALSIASLPTIADVRLLTPTSLEVAKFYIPREAKI